MGSILANSILDRAATVLQDITNVRWPRKELAKWLDDGQREIVLMKPEANVTNASYRLIAGTKQAIPDGSVSYIQQGTSTPLPNGIQLIDVVRNMGTTTAPTPGRAISVVDKRILNSQNREWHMDTASAEVVHFVFNEFDPKHYYVYPPQPTSNQGYVEIVYSSAPVDVTKKGGGGLDAEEPSDVATITLDDIFANVLLDYVLYRAYSKDANYAGNAERARAHMAAFVQSLTGKESGEMMSDVNIKNKQP